MTQIRASRDSAALPLTIAVTRPQGATGLTLLLEIRDGSTLNSYLDFSDDTFKTLGWGTKSETMSELANGFYSNILNISSLTNIPTLTEHLVAEYRSLGVTPPFAGEDIISLPLNVDAGVDEIRVLKEAKAVASNKISVTSFQYAYMDHTGTRTLFVNEDNDPTSRDRIFP